MAYLPYLTPELTTPERPRNLDAEAVGVGSYLLLRLVLGVLGIALPIVLVLGDALFLESGMSARGSLSAYYHSGMRDVFVGILVVVGLFLITYKIFKKSLDNTLSVIAGLAALGVAFFPTGIPATGGQLTPLQERLGESPTKVIHFGSATVFIVLLAVISVFFGLREGRRPTTRVGYDPRRSPGFWRRFHLKAAGTIIAAIVFIAVTKLTGVWDTHALLIGETIAVWAFGVSWLAKGYELRTLGRLRAASKPFSPQVSPSTGG